MDFKTLHEKYQQLLLENNRLKEEIKRLKTQLGIEVIPSQVSRDLTQNEALTNAGAVAKHASAAEPELFDLQTESTPSTFAEGVNKGSGSSEKIQLFISLFRGRSYNFV